MLKIEFDMSDWERQAQSIEGAVDQLPFAMALAMNRSADVTRQYLIKATWQHVKQRNQSFISASLTTKDSRASKQSLAVEIYDKLDRGNLQMHRAGHIWFNNRDLLLLEELIRRYGRAIKVAEPARHDGDQLTAGDIGAAQGKQGAAAVDRMPPLGDGPTKLAAAPKPRADPVCGARGRTWYTKDNGWRYWRCNR